MKFPIFNSSYSGIGISRWMHLLILGSALLVPSAKAGHPEDPINLNSAGDFVILAKSGITNVPDSDITGDMGVSPIDSTAITGFALIMDSSNEFSTSAQVTGEIYASDYSPPTPTKMTTAISDMETAYTVAAGRTDPDTTNLGGGEIGGLTISPGLHKWGTGVGISNNVTLDAGGVPDAVFIFQIEGDLNVSSGQSVILAGGAQAKNIFWQVAGGSGAVIGTTAHFEGVLLTATKIDLLTNATFNGKLLAQTAVNLDQNIIVDSEQINQYTLIYEASLGGSILGDSPQFVMEGEDGTQVEANAEPGFVFVEWSDGSIDNPRTDLNVQEDITVEAQFVEILPNQFVLTYTAGPGGSVSGVSPQIVDQGEDGTEVTAEAAPGFVFVEWLGTHPSNDNPRTDTNVQADVTVEAQFVAAPPSCGIPITLGTLLENDLSGSFTGENLFYTASSSDPTIMTAVITADNKLRTEALSMGQVEITVTASDLEVPDQVMVLLIDVVGHPTTVSSDFLPWEPWNPRFTQEITVRNDEPCDAIGIRLLFSDIEDGIVVENQNGTAPEPDGRVAISMAFPFESGASVDLSVVYLSTGAFRPDQHPPTIEIQFIMADTPQPAEGDLAPNITRIQTMDDGRVFIEFASVAGTHYQIDYTDDLNGGTWHTVALDLLAGANFTQWIDQGPPATAPMTNSRFYRVRAVTP